MENRRNLSTEDGAGSQENKTEQNAEGKDNIEVTNPIPSTVTQPIPTEIPVR